MYILFSFIPNLMNPDGYCGPKLEPTSGKKIHLKWNKRKERVKLTSIEVIYSKLSK